MKLWSSRVFDFVISDSGIFGCVEFFKTTLLRRRPPHRLREKESVPVLGLCSREASADHAAEENDACQVHERAIWFRFSSGGLGSLRPHTDNTRFDRTR